MKKKRSDHAWRAWIFSAILIAMSISIVSADQTDNVEIPLSSGIVKLIKPIEIVHADMFRDGGTMEVTLKDKDGRTFTFCLDGRMQSLGLWKKPRPYYIFIGVSHPDMPGGKPIPVGGKEEKAILKMLEDWINENISAEDQKNVSDVSMHKKIAWTDQLYKARRILQLIDRLKQR